MPSVGGELRRLKLEAWFSEKEREPRREEAPYKDDHAPRKLRKFHQSLWILRNTVNEIWGPFKSNVSFLQGKCPILLWLIEQIPQRI